MIVTSSNGRILLTSNENSIESDLEELIPYIVILSAWKFERVSIEHWREWVYILIDRGAKYIACIGLYSEKLHDEIDELIYQYEDIHNENNLTKIVTTYHVNDTIDEVVNYCIHGIEIQDKNSNCIVAILDEKVERDCELLECLKRA